jgi:hypothetical protein
VPAPRHFAACTVVALVLAGCGETGKGKLNANQADKLSAQVEAAQSAADNGQCGKAQEAASEGAEIASGIQKGVDPELQDNLVEGFNHLGRTVDSDCEKPEKTPTPTPSPVETVTEVPTEVPTEEPTPTPTPTPTEVPTEVPTEAPTEVPTEDTGGIPSDGDDG